jgi:2-haloacid dehalogenase
MAIPKQVSFVTFDVYGTLIDWETGVFDAFSREAERDGFTVDRDELIPLFHEVQQRIQAGSYELYAEVLRRTAVEISKTLIRCSAGLRSRRPTRCWRRSPRSTRWA